MEDNKNFYDSIANFTKENILDNPNHKFNDVNFEDKEIVLGNFMKDMLSIDINNKTMAIQKNEKIEKVILLYYKLQFGEDNLNNYEKINKYLNWIKMLCEKYKSHKIFQITELLEKKITESEKIVNQYKSDYKNLNPQVVKNQMKQKFLDGDIDYPTSPIQEEQDLIIYKLKLAELESIKTAFAYLSLLVLIDK